MCPTRRATALFAILVLFIPTLVRGQVSSTLAVPLDAQAAAGSPSAANSQSPTSTQPAGAAGTQPAATLMDISAEITALMAQSNFRTQAFKMERPLNDGSVPVAIRAGTTLNSVSAFVKSIEASHITMQVAAFIATSQQNAQDPLAVELKILALPQAASQIHAQEAIANVIPILIAKGTTWRLESARTKRGIGWNIQWNAVDNATRLALLESLKADQQWEVTVLPFNAERDGTFTQKATLDYRVNLQ